MTKSRVFRFSLGHSVRRTTARGHLVQQLSCEIANTHRHTDTHTQQADCPTWTTLWSVNMSLRIRLRCHHTAHSYTPFTRYNRLSHRLYNRFDNRLYRVNGALLLRGRTTHPPCTRRPILAQPVSSQVLSR